VLYAIQTDRIFRIPAIRLAEAQGAHCEDVYLYEFAWRSPMFGGALAACHAIEVPFVFGALGLEGADKFAGSGPDALRLSEITMDAWIAFAKRGDPSHRRLPGGRWPRYQVRDRATLTLDRSCALDLDPRSAERQIWDGIL
jgi:para-nitrobenzyl esterase